MNTCSEPAHVLRSVKIQPGTYFLGDPSQVLTVEKFDELVDASCDFSRVARDGDSQVIAFPARKGGRVYNDDDGKAYLVESGLIGLTPTHMVDDLPAALLPKRGRVVQFDGAVRCTRRADGVLTFGRYRIHTGR